MNLGIFAGRIGRDAELRHTKDGKPLASFLLAVDTGTKTKPETLWVDCALFGERAGSLAAYLTKGSQVTVQGRVSAFQFVKDGETVCRVRVAVYDVALQGKPRSQDHESDYVAAPPASPSPRAPSAPPAPKVGWPQKRMDELEDDIPF